MDARTLQIAVARADLALSTALFWLRAALPALATAALLAWVILKEEKK